MQKVKIDVTKDGKAQIDFEGFVGNACTKESSKLKEMLALRGVQIDDETVAFKPEYSVPVLVEETSRLPAQRQTEKER